MASPASKRQKTSSISEPEYELLYWPKLPGRGEPIRLCFEETGTPYKDTTNESKQEGMGALLKLIAGDHTGEGANPPILAPPILKHGTFTIGQLPNILLYLGPKLGLAGPEGDEHAIYHINQLALTALDGLSNEAHDVHHPVAVGAYYEEQKEEAKRKAKDYLSNRIPKFLGYFERVLQAEASMGGEYLYGGVLTWADLVLWHCIDGVSHAFPKAMQNMILSGMFGKVFAHQRRIGARENIANYLESDRRQAYGKGIYRHYPELDVDRV